MVWWGGLGLGGLPAGDGAETGWASHRGAGDGVRAAARLRRAVRGLGCHLQSSWAKGAGWGPSPNPSSSVNFAKHHPRRSPAAAQGGQARRAPGSHSRSGPLAPPQPPHCWGAARAWGGAGAPVRPALPGMPPAPAPARPAARKACTQRAAAVTTRGWGPAAGCSHPLHP